MKVTYESIWKGIRQVKLGARLRDIGYAIQHYAVLNGYSVVREYCGHGIGRDTHGEAQLLYYGH